MKYLHYTSEDFALDEQFQQWVLNPNADTNQFWKEWLATNPQKQKEVSDAIELIKLVGLSEDHTANTHYLEVWNELKQNSERNSRVSRPVWKYAAACIGIGMLIVVGLWWKYSTLPEKDKLLTYKTGYGQTKSIQLPDGSRITLNTNSKVYLSAQDWNKQSERTVYIDGEAFFEVAHTPDHKRFIVNTPHKLNIEVLGTKFNVNARRNQAEVYLQSGKVKLTSNTENLLLVPGQMAEYNLNDRQITVHSVDGKACTAWQNHFFVFDDEPLSKVAETIEDYFGVKVRIADQSLAQQRITARIPQGNIEVLLDILTAMLKIKVIRKNTEIILQQKQF
ncbi:FecR domain-containing protein [Cytophagaceae bacterium DM2B3-1]|uniref:FecR domain-containing protein n=1 Tax=Xanthocytophaga flava TaxID=3048013 RepID=A0ABT7CG57_9BACT|nr:FecR domain-containing protein [Xanthocytophaga flavus]MDJ1466631.1 FecR domain-containing protein [Xanthocytophaga flavus]MDJ1492627.1 FecR domain-containing protein [Xanthocytophaga flavus]